MQNLPIFVLTIFLCACGSSLNNTDSTDTTGDTSSSNTFTLKSPAVVNEELLANFQCEPKNNGIEDSIPLSWSGVPEDTQSLAIIMHHYPNPNDTTSLNSYLLLWGINPEVSDIAHGAADDSAGFMGANKDGDAVSYTSPCSPSAGSHNYTITLYALSSDPASAGLVPAQSTIDVDYSALRTAIDNAGIIAETALTFNSTTEADSSAITPTDCRIYNDPFSSVSDLVSTKCDSTFL